MQHDRLGHARSRAAGCARVLPRGVRGVVLNQLKGSVLSIEEVRNRVGAVHPLFWCVVVVLHQGSSRHAKSSRVVGPIATTGHRTKIRENYAAVSDSFASGLSS